MGTFDKVDSLLKRKKHASVLTLLLNKKNKINESYASDKSDENHSWYIVGVVLYRQRKYQEAAYAFQKAIKAWKDDGEALVAIGNSYSELGRPKLAERYFRKALTHAKQTYAARYNLGNALFDQGRYAEAIRYYKNVPRKEKEIYKLAQKNIKNARNQ